MTLNSASADDRRRWIAGATFTLAPASRSGKSIRENDPAATRRSASATPEERAHVRESIGGAVAWILPYY